VLCSCFERSAIRNAQREVVEANGALVDRSLTGFRPTERCACVPSGERLISGVVT
jgi:hypothetical protein